ncbi:hypothetical protein EON63_18810 [archaeon]|nr:MAG: hypothetical protein EON63_18810 [archaeon]
MVYGTWCMVYGIWCMVYGIWYMVFFYYFYFTVCVVLCMVFLARYRMISCLVHVYSIFCIYASIIVITIYTLYPMLDDGVQFVGQSMGLVRDVPSVDELVQKIIMDAQDRLQVVETKLGTRV